MKNRRKQRQTKAHAVKWGILVVLVSVCLLGVAGARGVLSLIDEWTADLPSVTNSAAFEYSAKTRIYANDRTTMLAEFYLQNQDPVEASEVSKYVLDGTVATEDVRFYEHNGVDPTGIARAVMNNITGGELEGASTITQQLVRNTLLSNEATDISIKRKVREAALALEMEKTYSKQEILMMYLNTINYGDGCYGIQAAARHYFQKSAKDLTIAEAATLVGIPQSPTYNNPVNYPDNCLARRNTVLDRMVTNGYITAAEHDAAVAQPLGLNVESERAADGIYMYPYFTSYVREILLNELSYEQVFDGGLTVYTTIDPKMQGYAEEAAAQTYETMAQSGDTDVKLSLTCIDPNTGYVLAMIGGKNYSESEYNLATSASGRQTGSTFKMFTLAAAIEQGISPQTLMDCSSPAEIKGWGSDNRVENYDNTSYGTKTIEQMTWVSANTGFARLVTEDNGVKPSSIVEMAARLDVTGSNGYGAYPSITLGTAQSNTLRMASAYGALSTGGMYYEDQVITEVLDANNNRIIDHRVPTGKRALSEEVAYAVTKVLKGVIQYGTAAGTSVSNGEEIAGKTGTSEEHRDLWFCGYSPTYSVAVWTGADPEREMWEASWCKTCWQTFMNKALEGKTAAKFKTASDPTYDSKYKGLGNAAEIAAKQAAEEAEKKAKEEAEKAANAAANTSAPANTATNTATTN